jgi:NDP-sugar pyrophosphorylase family protein
MTTQTTKSHHRLVILAGGASSRMKKPVVSNQQKLSEEEIQQANERSKTLIGVGEQGRPLLDYVFHNASKAGYKDIYIVTGEDSKLFRAFYGDKTQGNCFHGLSISFATQKIPADRVKPLGAADALWQTVEQYPELKEGSYSVCNSDNLYSVAALKALRKTETPNALIAYDRDALNFPPERISRFAIARFDKGGYLLDVIEKPESSSIEEFRDSSKKLRVSMNAFKFDGAMLYPFLKNCPLHPDRNEKELPTALLNMMEDHPKNVLGIPFSEHVPDLTSKEDIAEVKKYLQTQFKDFDWNEA